MRGDLEPGDRVIVERTPDPKEILTDAIYLIRMEGTIMFKALQQRPGGHLLVISRKESYPNYSVDPQTNDFEVIGKVWGRFERLG
jgi:phage repressor protein C with HTH and peptisase S24 domain